MRNALDHAIGTTPVSTVDIDSVIASGRRRGLRRRLTVGASGFAAVGLAAAIAVTMVGPPGPSRSPINLGPAAGDSAPVRGGETRDQASLRMAAALTAGLTAALPGVHLSDGPTGQAGVTVSYDETRGGYTTDTVLAAANGAGEVFLESLPGGQAPPPTTPTGWPSGQPAPPTVLTWLDSCADLPTGQTYFADGHLAVQECHASTGAGGQTIVAVSARCVDCPGQPTFSYNVYVTWSNARVNLSIERDTKRGGPNDSQSAPLLNEQQLIAIATDPELTTTS
jgi:hypothetical protein